MYFLFKKRITEKIKNTVFSNIAQHNIFVPGHNKRYRNNAVTSNNKEIDSMLFLGNNMYFRRSKAIHRGIGHRAVEHDPLTVP